MNINNILKKIDFELNKEELKAIADKTKLLLNDLKNEIKKSKVKAEAFVGGSFAKGTLIKEKGYDIDIFVRFDKKYLDKISEILEKIINNLSKRNKFNFEKIHGSRDYFRILDNETRFEIIPVIKVKSPKESENVTDLSYFHVNYVKRKINSRIAREIGITKAFLKATGAYGAESYIRGISGYGVECLLIYYKTFEKFAKAILKSNENEKIIIDIEKKYKNKQEIMINVNESKTQSPIILIDPTWKERNVLAALSKETFEKLKEEMKKFIANPNIKYFENKEIDLNKLREYAKKGKYEFLTVNLKTDRQEGDIAGTKLKKFTLYLEEEISKYYKIIKKEFVYDEAQSGQLYLIVKPNKEFIKVGPPLKMKSECIAFKSQNNAKSIYVKAGRLFSKTKIDFTCKSFLNDFKEKYKDKIESMDVEEIRVY